MFPHSAAGADSRTLKRERGGGGQGPQKGKSVGIFKLTSKINSGGGIS